MAQQSQFTLSPGSAEDNFWMSLSHVDQSKIYNLTCNYVGQHIYIDIKKYDTFITIIWQDLHLLQRKQFSWSVKCPLLQQPEVIPETSIVIKLVNSFISSKKCLKRIIRLTFCISLSQVRCLKLNCCHLLLCNISGFLFIILHTN